MKTIVSIGPLSMALAIILLVGCAALGVPSADTFNKKWAEAQQTDTGVLTNALTLAKAGKITPDQLRKVEQQTDNAKAGLDLARELHKTNSAAGEDRLAQILAGLTTLENALASPDPNSSLSSALSK